MQILAFAFASLGVFFIFLSLFGALKMKDVFLRLQVASKASTLGLIFCLAGASIAHPGTETWTKISLTILFLFLTTPIAAQAIASLGHHSKDSSEHMVIDELDQDLKRKL